MSKPIDYNAVTNICIRIMDFFADEYPNIEENKYFVEQDYLRTVIEAWLRQNNIPFEEK